MQHHILCLNPFPSDDMWEKESVLVFLLKCDLLKSISGEYVTQKLLSKEKFGSTCATFAA